MVMIWMVPVVAEVEKMVEDPTEFILNRNHPAKFTRGRTHLGVLTLSFLTQVRLH